MCGLAADESLPEKLVGKYWALRYCLDRVQSPLLDGDLARLCVECGFGKPTAAQTAGPGFVDLWFLKRVRANDPVVVDWRGKKVSATLVGVTIGKQVRVLIENEERLVQPEQVTLPAAA